MRRKIKARKPIGADAVYNSEKVSKMVNYVMFEGKKNTARKVVYGALEVIKVKAKTETPLEVLDTALKNTAPLMEVRSRRVGGANYQVPREVPANRRNAMSMKWIIDAARSKKGKPTTKNWPKKLLPKNEGEG